MKFLKLDKKKGSGGPSIKSRYAYLIYLDDIADFPLTNEKGVRLVGDIVLKEDCKMMPLYLTSSSQEFSYDILGDDDEKSYLVKFSGNHPGTELEALEFAKNMIEQPYLVLIPSCNESEPWKLLGEITNPLIFTSSHKGGSNSSKFTFNFEQRIGSEFIYFSYGGVEVPSGGEGVDPPSGGFDPTKWARIDASNIDEHISEWQEKLGIVTDLSPYATTAQLDTEIVNRALEDAKKLDKPLTPNNTAERLIQADGGTTAKSNYQRSKQFFVTLPATVSENWKGCIVFFTSSGNLTVPIGLTSDFTFNGVVDNGVTLTPAITSPMTWLGTAPTAFSGVAIFTMIRRDGTNNFQILGV